MKDPKKFLMALALNVNGKTKQKGKLTYLSWAWAWSEFKKIYPDGTYKVWRDEKGKPYVFDEDLGYMVFTEVTVDGEVYPMQLTVMDGANKTMKNKSYTYKVKEWKNGRPTGNFIDKPVEAAAMFDINTSIMRCLTKNFGMLGIGSYIYAGEDLPDISVEIKEEQDAAEKEKATKRAEKKLADMAEEKIKYDSELIIAIEKMGKTSSSDGIKKVWRTHPVFKKEVDFIEAAKKANVRISEETERRMNNEF